MSAPNIIILGPQGAGKSTQAALLAKETGFVLFGAGDVLRKIAEEDTELGRTVRQTINVEGNLVQPELISEVLKERIAAVPKDKGLIVDGYPRTMSQFSLFRKFWPETKRGDYRVIFIELSDEDAIKRLASRVACGRCGAIHTEGTKKCSECGGELVKRSDDSLPAIQKRLELFHSETIPMIQVMEADGNVLHIDGSTSRDEIHSEIVKKLKMK